MWEVNILLLNTSFQIVLQLCSKIRNIFLNWEAIQETRAAPLIMTIILKQRPLFCYTLFSFQTRIIFIWGFCEKHQLNYFLKLQTAKFPDVNRQKLTALFLVLKKSVKHVMFTNPH